MINEVFTYLGLDQKDFKIYKTILSMRDVAASVISKKLNLPRSTVQYKCTEMAKKGILSVFEKNNTFYFSPEHPDKVKRIIEEKKAKAEKIALDFESIFPALISNYLKYGNQSKIRFFDGAEGIKNMFKDVLDSKCTLYGLTRNEGNMSKEILDWLEHSYIPERIKNNKGAFILFNENETTRFYITRDKLLKRISLLVPEKIFPFSACCHIYEGKVAFYSYTNDDMTGVLIENRHIFVSMMSLFKLAWMGARNLEINKKYKEVDLPY